MDQYNLAVTAHAAVMVADDVACTTHIPRPRGWIDRRLVAAIQVVHGPKALTSERACRRQICAAGKLNSLFGCMTAGRDLRLPSTRRTYGEFWHLWPNLWSPHDTMTSWCHAHRGSCSTTVGHAYAEQSLIYRAGLAFPSLLLQLRSSPQCCNSSALMHVWTSTRR